jgi:hypothetical protein
MKTLECRRLVAVAMLLLTSMGVACSESPQVERISVSLRNTETYRYATVGGDEEGASISAQAQHYIVSEVRRDRTTGWIATYIYQRRSALSARTASC